ncbi:hypothetical protein HMF3257_36370 [Spirosoma telluris]|uniref:Uncharacterized protein n=1 Tax=Spirosoma telluris TaxID=2183553 RepID=A0A327NUF7_9BACT|nr:hypothetical protein HMF3257_36370 [Spirosoma telluris]
MIDIVQLRLALLLLFWTLDKGACKKVLFKMNTTMKDQEPAEGDYYGTIYKGPLILPILGIVVAVALWWFWKKRR